MQIIGRHGDDLGVLALAETVEEQRPWAGEYALL
jgi:Asp-tRNA(Asn)/Glu-tRNA(Gln) amidotransferase A subunit family amidase